jgi:hypothetical protein
LAGFWSTAITASDTFKAAGSELVTRACDMVAGMFIMIKRNQLHKFKRQQHNMKFLSVQKT